MFSDGIRLPVSMAVTIILISLINVTRGDEAEHYLKTTMEFDFYSPYLPGMFCAGIYGN